MSAMLAFGRFVCRGLISVGVGVVASSEKETEILGFSPHAQDQRKLGLLNILQLFRVSSYKC